MTARRTILLGSFLIAALAAGAWFWHAHHQTSRWNLLLVTVSGLRADHLGAYGDANAQTPTIDAIAARGALFENAVAASPVSLPSHASMLTGLHPLEHGLVTGGTGRLPDDVVTLAEVLSEHGFQTAAFTSAYALDSRFGLDQGYSLYDDDLSGTERGYENLYVERSAESVIDDALVWIEQNSTKPFHAWIHLNDPKLPFEPHPVDGNDPFADAPYDGEIAYVDRQLARLIDLLDRRQLTQRTLIVLVGDHGAGLGDHEEEGSGLLLHGSTLHVPLMIAPPTGSAQPKQISDPVSLVDVTPTLHELLGLPVTQTAGGVSLAAALHTRSAPARECLSMTAEPLLQHGWSPMNSLTTPEWKFVSSSIPELYDLKADPGETGNLAAAQPDRVAELKTRLEELVSKLNANADATALLTAARERAAAWSAGLGGANGSGDPADIVLPDVKGKLPLLARTREAIRLLDDNQPQTARQVLREVLDSDPQLVEAWGLLGRCLIQTDETEEAIACFQKVLQFDPRNTNVLLNLAAAQAKTQRMEDAIATYKAAIASDPDSPVPLHFFGVFNMQTGNQYEAEVLFAKSVQRDPTYDPGISSQGDLAIAQGDGVRALERYIAAITVNPRAVNAHINLGVYAAQSQNFDAAEQHFRDAIAVAPGDPLAAQSLARIELFRGETSKAVEKFEAVLAAHPDHYSTLVTLGWLRAVHPDDTVRDSQAALELANRVVSLPEGDSPGGLDLLAAAQASAGNYDEALATLDRALELAANIPDFSVEEIAHRRRLYAARTPYRSTLTEAADAGGH